MTDLMLLGVLRMPWDDQGDLTLVQVKNRCRQAADRIEELETELAAALARLEAAEKDAHNLQGALALVMSCEFERTGAEPSESRYQVALDNAASLLSAIDAAQEADYG